jgi:putative ABC transport system permease protein
VLDTLEASIKVGSETRLVTRNAISLIFPLPLSYRDRLTAIPRVQRRRLRELVRRARSRGRAQLLRAVRGRRRELPADLRQGHRDHRGQPVPGPAVVPEGVDSRLAAFIAERTACVVGQKLFERMKWKLGQTVTLSGTIFPGTWPFVIRAVYHAKDPAFGEEALLFHWKYLEEKGMGGQGQVGWYILQLSDPSGAGDVTRTVDTMFENSSARTHTETERAFQAGFVSMYGNVPFLIGVIGLAVVFAILLVAANTMMMAIRERTAEVGC